MNLHTWKPLVNAKCCLIYHNLNLLCFNYLQIFEFPYYSINMRIESCWIE